MTEGATGPAGGGGAAFSSAAGLELSGGADGAELFNVGFNMTVPSKRVSAVSPILTGWSSSLARLRSSSLSFSSVSVGSANENPHFLLECKKVIQFCANL